MIRGIESLSHEIGRVIARIELYDDETLTARVRAQQIPELIERCRELQRAYRRLLEEHVAAGRLPPESTS